MAVEKEIIKLEGLAVTPAVSINKPLWKIAGILATTLLALMVSNKLFYL